MSICSDPDVLSIFYIITAFVNIAMFVAPVLLIVLTMVDLIKGISGDESKLKNIRKSIITRIVALVILLLVPLTIEFSQGLMGDNELEYLKCFTDANADDIGDIRYDLAEDALLDAELKQNRYYYDKASLLVAKVTDKDDKEELEERLDELDNIITQIEQGKLPQITTDDLAFDGLGAPSKHYSNLANKNAAVCVAGTEYEYAPQPDLALNFWEGGKSVTEWHGDAWVVDSEDYYYPATAQGVSLGAWPKIDDYPLQLENPKIYFDNFIWPVDTAGGYSGNYVHNGPEYGMDILTYMGTPVYAPASGVLEYSEYGHTGLIDCQDTAYSVRIRLDEPVRFNGVVDPNPNNETYDPPVNVDIEVIFITHLMGIRYYCPEDSCYMRVEAGELIGFSGTAGGISSETGKPRFAPHLHMTFYDDIIVNGVASFDFNHIYSIDEGDKRMAGE